MKAIIFISMASIVVFTLACSNEKKIEAQRQAEIESGRKQWEVDYYGSERVPTDEEAISAAKRAIAYEDMRSIVSAQKEFYSSNSRYTDNLSELDFRQKSKVYSYSVSIPASRSLRITATGELDEDSFREIIVMNQLGDVEIVEDDIRDWKQTDGIRNPGRLTQKARDSEKKLHIGTSRRMQDLGE